MRVCFFALNAYPTLAGTLEARVGGAEVQQRFLARYLVEHGHEVSFVTRDHGQEDAEVIDGITIYKAFKQGVGVPVFRYFHPRCTGSWAALKRADADIYYQRCAGMETGLLALFCKYYRKKFVFASGSDSDFKPSEIIAASTRDKYLYTYGLKRADAIAAQTETQKRLLKESFGYDAAVIPNSWGSGEIISTLAGVDGYILWVSTLRAWKRPELFIDLAEALPHLKFVMVGGIATGEQGIYEAVEARAKKLPNVSFKGFVPFKDIGQFFDGARVLVNTSEPKEGFPNTFLQAWQRAVPVVSYFDPDGIIAREGAGKAVSTKEEMKLALSGLMDNDEEYLDFQQRAKAYFESNHRIEVVGANYENLFKKI